jgi:hypothetical protein
MVEVSGMVWGFGTHSCGWGTLVLGWLHVKFLALATAVELK